MTTEISLPLTGLNCAGCVRKAETASTGQTIVALIDDAEATVKRFYREADSKIRLQPANATMEPMIYPAEAVKIQGVVVGLLRKYAA